ncbi:MAG TPA: carboxypeptidase-like regulatory domain-containing protein [Terracidiphilus sp.]|nr:carboxypeptidase-like regulatory domain-containing protein [Terracidiphilus sp.]
MKVGPTKTLAGVAFAALTLGVVPAGPAGGLAGPPPALAQNIGQRVVDGTVVDASSSAVSGATVFLKDLKTKTIRSFTSDPQGKFRFTQVDMAEDHELWAEKAGHKSAVKTVSQWDARKDFETELKLK